VRALLRRLAGEDLAPEMPADQYVPRTFRHRRVRGSRFMNGQIIGERDLNEMLDRIAALERGVLGRREAEAGS